MNLNIVGYRLQIEFEWYEQIFAVMFNKTLEIPLHHIIDASTEEPPSTWSELRAPGSFIPGVIKAGTYYSRRGKEFWYVTKDRDYLVLQLSDEPFNKIILTLDQNATWAERIAQYINSETSTDDNPF